MLEERVVVMRVEADRVWVRPLGPEQCRRCAEGRGCGGGFFSRIVRRSPRDIPARHAISDLRVGEQVVVALAEDALMKASLILYLLPLAGMLALGVFAQVVLDTGDLLVAGFGLAGLILGLACARVVGQRAQADPLYQLRVKRRVRPDAEHCARLPLAALHRDQS